MIAPRMITQRRTQPVLSVTHGAADALVPPAVTEKLIISKTGKSTTSVVPFGTSNAAASAAEDLRPRFAI